MEFSDRASNGLYDKEFVVDFPYENVEYRIHKYLDYI